VSVYIHNHTLLTKKVGRVGAWHHLCLYDVKDESLQFEEDRSEPGGGHETCLNCTQKAMSRRRENEGGMWGEATSSKGTKRERDEMCAFECVNILHQ